MLKPIVIACFLIFSSPGESYAQHEAVVITQSFIEHLKNKDFAQAHTFFADDIKTGFPVETFESMWYQILDKFGKFKSYQHNCSEEVEGSTVVYTTCEFKESTFDIKAIIDEANLIRSFTMSEIHNCGPKESYKNPPYDDHALYTTEQVEFESDKFKIPGTLTASNNKNKAVIIFVHGSGPNDRDESLGPNKMFRDLAVGLAAKGYSTLRYDKRTYLKSQLSAEDAANLTIQTEVLDDVQSAISFLQSHDLTKNLDIYILGHSLGAMLIQKTAVDNEAVKGIIMMAGPAGPFESLLPMQYEYLLGLDGKLNKSDKNIIAEMERKVQLVQKNLTEDTPASDLPLGIPAKYWLSLKDYNQIELAKQFKGRIMIMNGGRDYQVPLSEFEKWKEALGEKENVTFAECPTVNHMFFEGEGAPSPDEYDLQKNVPEVIILGICEWLDGNW